MTEPLDSSVNVDKEMVELEKAEEVFTIFLVLWDFAISSCNVSARSL